MYKHINIEKVQDLSLWCSILVAFYCLFRKANVVPKDSDFDPDCVLKRSDVVIDNESRNILIYVNFSKTNQYQRSFHVIPIPANDDPALDLFHHMKKLFSTVTVPESSPAFMFSNSSYINYRSFTTRLKTLLAKAGLEPALYFGQKRWSITLIWHRREHLDGPGNG